MDAKDKEIAKLRKMLNSSCIKVARLLSEIKYKDDVIKRLRSKLNINSLADEIKTEWEIAELNRMYYGGKNE